MAVRNTKFAAAHPGDKNKFVARMRHLVPCPRDYGMDGGVAPVSKPAVVWASSPALGSGAITESCGRGASVVSLKFM